MSRPVDPGTRTGQIARDLRRRIESGQFGVGGRIPSAAALCAQYGVSNITARAAVRELVAQGLVESRGRAGVFVSKPPTHAPRAVETRTIGLILPRADHPFFIQFLPAIEQACRAAGYGLRIVGSDQSAVEEVAILRDLSTTLAGLLVMPIPGTHAYGVFGDILAQRRPIVLLGRYLDGLDLPAAVSDNEAAGFMMTGHLLAQGLRHIYVLQDYSDSAARDRIDGCHRAMRELNRHDATLEIVVGAPLGEATGYRLTRDVLKMEPHGRERFGVFALNQELARGSMVALREERRSIPGDVALAGFDDTYAMYFDPPLTTISQGLPKIGAQAVALLLRQIEGAWPAPGQRVVRIGPELIVRNSTDPRSRFSLERYLSKGVVPVVADTERMMPGESAASRR